MNADISNALFPVISGTESLFQGINNLRPRPRKEALVRAIKERSLLLDVERLTQKQPEADQYVTLAQWGGNPEHLSVDAWEMSSLGLNFPVISAKHGDQVRSALRPAFQAHQRLFVIDPYFGADKEELIAALLATASNTSHLEVLATEPRYQYQNGTYWNGKFTRRRIERLALRLVDFLLGSPSGQTQDQTRQFVWWYVNRDRDVMHDRYIGFQPQRRQGHSPYSVYHALTIGSGVESLVERPNRNRYTYLARVSSSHFSKIWHHWQQQAVFCICADNHSVQKSWGQEVASDALRRKLDETHCPWSVRIYEFNSPHRAL